MSKITAGIALILVALGACAYAQVSNAPAVTTTALSISPSDGMLVAGSPLTLTARVSAQGAPITRGTVVFCAAGTPRCTDLSVLGKAQLTGNGTASVKLTLGVGSYVIRAEFRGTPHGSMAALASASATRRITVNPNTAASPVSPRTLRAPSAKGATL